eukprot:TRINITY_DN779829_c0_g1_i1.p1 TRINITY_DN779829_c0_g1~~TRINITY_DN779829_c0_g1_i1.p1  ORF type:complete len:225 (+),score=36.08 TRINITY_DN779829_c0_g1_i1:59-733(+)
MADARNVFLFVPNVIGYFRLLLVGVAGVTFTLDSFSIWSPICIIVSNILDLFDGIAARKLNQTSVFGQYFDIVIDNIARTFSWIVVANHWNEYRLFSVLAVFLSSIEWLTMFSTQMTAEFQKSGHWKEMETKTPKFIQMMFKNGFKNWFGVPLILSFFVLPLLLQTNPISQWLNGFPFVLPTAVILFASFRLCGLITELWFIWRFIKLIGYPINAFENNMKVEE